jgi:hypothetical protein
MCKTTPEQNKKMLSVDHDHATGRVRALLCHVHNTALGMLQDDPKMAEEAAAYLHRHGPQPTPTELTAIVAMMKANHLTHYKADGVEITLDPSAWAPEPLPPQTVEELQKIMADAGPGLTDEETLFYSVEAVWQDPQPPGKQ